MRSLSVALVFAAPVFCSLQQKYSKATSTLLPDRVFCGSDGTKALAWDFKLEKIVKIVSHNRSPVLQKVDSIDFGTSGNLNFEEQKLRVANSADLEECTGDIKFYYSRFKPTKLCGGSGFQALFYQGIRRGVFEILQNNQKVMTLVVKIDHRTGFEILNPADAQSEASKLGIDAKQLTVQGQGLSGYSIQPRIGSLRFCK